ncbi:GDP-mannose 4,6-dehydratase [Candidatus Roizmanbacteria bacterium]|nr:GDP-mannose 4,6-dehydratase [Candidatus Roizmanbacteria bacterium]
MNIVITGGAGFIGSNLASYHSDQNDTVFIIDNLITGSEENIKSLVATNRAIFFKADIAEFDYSQLPSISIVYNLASPASPVQYKKHSIETLMTNALGTQKLLEFCKNSPRTIFVEASTSEAYGDPLIHPQTEEYWGNVNPVGIRSCYDEAKRFAEALTIAYFRKYHLPLRIARIFNTYGPNMEKDDGRVISNFIMQSITNQPVTVYGDGTQTRSFCYVDDMVRAIVLLAKIPNIDGEVINVGNPDEKTINELASIVQIMTKTQSKIIFQPIDSDDPKKRKPDITKAKRLLGWNPQVSLEKGLQKTIAYFKERFA